MLVNFAYLRATIKRLVIEREAMKGFIFTSYSVCFRGYLIYG